MAGRNRMPPHPHDLPPFGRGPPLPGMPPSQHPHLLDDMGRPPLLLRGGPRGGGGGDGGGLRHLPHPAAMFEEHMAAQHQEIQVLLVDNQRLAATHVALKQELVATQNELHRASSAVSAMHADHDARLREVYEKSMKMEAELRAVEAMRAELVQVHGDVQNLNASRKELTGQIQTLTQDLTRASTDVQKGPAIKADIEAMKQELQRARQAIEFEKKGYAENYEQGQTMEKNLISMAREVEKLHAEIANAEKRARASVAAGNQGYGGNYGNPDPSYGGGNYGNPDPSYGANPYPAGYGMNTAPGNADGASQYGVGAGAVAGAGPGAVAGTGTVAGSGHGSWGAYDMQRAYGRR